MPKKLLSISITILSLSLIFIFCSHFSNNTPLYYNKKPITKLADLSGLGTGTPVIVRIEKPNQMKRSTLKKLPSLVNYSHFEIDFRVNLMLYATVFAVVMWFICYAAVQLKHRNRRLEFEELIEWHEKSQQQMFVFA